MDAAAELQAAGRILARGTSGAVVAEVARDVVERWRGGAATLAQLGAAVGEARAAQGAAGLALLRAAVDAAADGGRTGAALALAAGVAAALAARGAGRTAAGERACAVVADLAADLAADHGADRGAVGAALDAAAAMAAAGLRGHVRRLARGGAVLRAAAVAERPEAVAALVEAGSLHDARWAADQVHCAAAALLAAQERSDQADPRAIESALAVLRVGEAVCARCFVDDAGVARAALVPLWCTVVDALALVHFATLALGGRTGPDAFRRAAEAAVRFVAGRADEADAAVRRLFAQQPCLRFLARQPVRSVAPARACVVLFYLDLLEHVAADLRPQTLARLVLPLAAQYARSAADSGADWFESGHALLLAALDAGAAREVVPWYAALLLRQYPDAGLSADLLRIAYTAAVRAAAPDAALARDCVAQLLRRLDDYAGAGPVATARRRELLGVLAAQLAAVPLPALPPLMAEVRARVTADPDWATRRALADALQAVVLDHADALRKPALATWVWQLRRDVNDSLDA
ncbi:hypothetical protein H4R18_000780 [Coemansia javaensis]|uniref:Uncharacterized protein n=1 Tax=Coemansia javaensis TaxID=2761396 RepID=A0A9W8LLL6_9FUNG|nr:hypothetical protein H4R18_000780 [Coemansia javaensis]